MPMPAYPLLCYQPGCGRPAQYKIAAEWSDGLTSELKTYGLCCAICLSAMYERSCQRQASCRLTAGEVLRPTGIYQLAAGQRDRQLARLPDLEARRGQAADEHPGSEHRRPPPS